MTLAQRIALNVSQLMNLIWWCRCVADAGDSENRLLQRLGLLGLTWDLLRLVFPLLAGIWLLSDHFAQVSSQLLRLQHVELLLKRRHSWAIRRGRRSGRSLSWGLTNLERMM